MMLFKGEKRAAEHKDINFLLWVMSLSSVSYLGPALYQHTPDSYSKHCRQTDSSALEDSVIFGLEGDIDSVLQKHIDDLLKFSLHWSPSSDYQATKHRLLSNEGLQRSQLHYHVLTAASLSEDQLKEMAKEASKKRQAEFYKVCQRKAIGWTQDTPLALQYANLVALCRILGYYGVLTRQEVVQELLSLGATVAAQYNSYREFGAKATIANELWVSYQNTINPYCDLDSPHFRLAHAMHAEWRLMSWPDRP